MGLGRLLVALPIAVLCVLQNCTCFLLFETNLQKCQVGAEMEMEG
jgi:hypothetical protein